MIAKVGGVAGLGSSQAKAEIILPKRTYRAGEVMTINIDMDNSKCKKKVKNFKIKMRRKVECLQKGGIVIWKKDEEIGGEKYPGVAAKTPPGR